MDVGALRCRCVGMTEPCGDLGDIPAGRDQGGAVRVAQVVEVGARWITFPSRSTASSPDRLTARASTRPAMFRWSCAVPSRETNTRSCGPLRVDAILCSRSFPGEPRRDLDAAPRPCCLERHALTVAVELVREREGRSVEVDVAPHQPECLAEAAAALGREFEDQPVAIVHTRKQSAQLVARQDALVSLILEPWLLGALEHRDRVSADIAKVASCVLEHSRDDGQMALDRPAF